MLLRLIDTGKGDPLFNMALDEAISVFVREDKSIPTIRFYEWEKPSITIGEFQKIEEVNLKFCNSKDIPIVRRPTGGKGILHYNDLTYSVSSKKEGVFQGSLFKTYQTVSKFFIQTFEFMGISVEIKEEKRTINKSPLCFARSSFGEICYGDIKIMGSAQKRWKDGFLQQGTIPIFVNRVLLKEIFSLKEEELSSVIGIKELFPHFEVEEFKEYFKLSLFKRGFKVVEEPLKDEEILLAQRLLIEKYQNPMWISKKDGSFKN